MPYWGYGVDVGGTSIKFGRFTAEGELENQWEIPTDSSQKGKNILPDIGRAIRRDMQGRGLRRENVLGIGIGVPGPVDGRGHVKKCVNLGWDTVVDVPAGLRKELDVPVHVGNDANVAALGEMWKGSASGRKNVVLFTLGTGLGGGVIIGGKMLSGSNGAGGEVGHIPMNPDETLPCPCGNYGCLEQYASATGVVRRARELLAETPAGSLLRAVPELTAKDVWDCYARGDALAAQVVEHFGRYLGRGAAAVACVADPEVFVLGGGMSKAGTPLLEVTRKYFRQYAFHAFRDCAFTLASLGNDAGIYGCMYLVLQGY